MKKILIIAVGLILALGLSFAPIPVKATPILDFNMDATHPATASISYAGGSAPLVGVDISVDKVELIGVLGSARTIFGGDLDFTTGNLTGFNPSTWYFGSGGSITLVGGVDLNNNTVFDGGDIPLGTTLFSGTFSSASVIAFDNNFKIAGASFGDVKDPDLLRFYGLPNLPFNGNFNISFNAIGLPPNAFISNPLGSGDIFNSPIPEPATMLLLGSGLIGLAGFARKRFKK